MNCIKHIKYFVIGFVQANTFNCVPGTHKNTRSVSSIIGNKNNFIKKDDI